MTSYISGIPPSCFGSVFWTMIHTVAIAYPEQVNENDPLKIKIYNFYKSLEDIIPCRECQLHYKENFKQLPLENYLNSRMDLFYWTYTLHNIVNEQLGVKDGIPTFEEAYDKYHSLRTENCGQGTVGVCKKNSNEMYCKVEILKRNEEHFSENTVHHYIIGFLLIIVVLLIYLLLKKPRK